MPRISEFAGILIYMYFADHNPPHFHAMYGGDTAVFAVEDGEILEGGIPGSQTKRVRKWAENHRAEIMENWNLCINGETPNWIDE